MIAASPPPSTGTERISEVSVLVKLRRWKRLRAGKTSTFEQVIATAKKYEFWDSLAYYMILFSVPLSCRMILNVDLKKSLSAFL